MTPVKAALVLEDGTAFEGKPFGKIGEAVGETVFYTGVVGYQEVITDPSYARTLTVLTYPVIGSYGVTPEDNESAGAKAGGIVVREYSRRFSNFRATGSLEEFLKEQGVVGIREVDTRAVAVHLREHGEMKGAIASGDFDPEALAEKLSGLPLTFEADLVKDVSREEVREAAGQEKHRIAVLNLGVKRSLLDQLAALGCRVDVLKCTATADNVLAKEPEGVVVAGGPGDPRVPGYAAETVKGLLGEVPIVGIGLGHQVLALALGCTVKRMRAGHRGVNYPVRESKTGKCEITVQHHSFVVVNDDEESVPDSVEITHVNVNDGTVEGVRSKDAQAWSVQFHPCPDEMERPGRILEEFCEGE